MRADDTRNTSISDNNKSVLTYGRSGDKELVLFASTGAVADLLPSFEGIIIGIQPNGRKYISHFFKTAALCLYNCAMESTSITSCSFSINSISSTSTHLSLVSLIPSSAGFLRCLRFLFSAC